MNVILGELSPSKGTCRVAGKVAYASQESWIFSGNVRQNILCGLEYDLKRYKKVIKACALDKDFSLFPNGDLTAVGERGVSLSGGQKARINLARALYVDADIYLMDDALSAVLSSCDEVTIFFRNRSKRRPFAIFLTHGLGKNASQNIGYFNLSNW